MAEMTIKDKRPPIPREGVYELYWQFAAARQHIFEARLRGEPGPWSKDPILNEFKFCNVFRAADRVSQYMIKDVAYRQDDSTPEDRLFQITAFRTFSHIPTWETLTRILGRSPRIADLASGAFEAALDQAKEENGKLYTHAFILCANDAYKRGIKHHNHVELFKDMFIKQELGRKLLEAKSLREIYELLHGFPLMGDFMSYQTAIDLNYSSYINFSENDFTQPGPGAIRGIKKVFADLGDYTPAEVIMWMVENQEKECQRLGLEFHGLFGRPIMAIDAQGLFCETDKYCREALPGLASARKKIKAHFREDRQRQPIDYFFPPKWGLDIA